MDRHLRTGEFPGNPGNPKQQTLLGLVTFLACGDRACGDHVDGSLGGIPNSHGVVTLEALLHDALPALESEAPGSLEYPALLASHVRQWMGDVDAAHRLLIHLARCPEYAPLLQRWTPTILTSPTELAMLLGQWQRQFGGWTRTGECAGIACPIPGALARGMRDAWWTFDLEDVRGMSKRKRALLRDWVRLNQLEPRTAQEVAHYQELGLLNPRHRNDIDFLGTPIAGPARTASRASTKAILQELPQLLRSGKRWDDLEAQLGDPTQWGPEIWPVMLFDRWLTLARMLPERHPWHQADLVATGPTIPTDSLISACEYLDRAFLQVAHRYATSKSSASEFVVLDNDPELRNSRVDIGPWTYPVASLSMAGMLLCSGQADSLWLLHPQWQCVVDEPLEQPLPVMARLLDKGKQSGSFRALSKARIHAKSQATSYCWISPRSEPPEPLQRAFRGRYAQSWLAPGKHLGHPSPDNQACFVGLSPTLLEVMQEHRQDGRTWSEFVQQHPIRPSRYTRSSAVPAGDLAT